jgi:peptidoglycan glycosyltransferase
VGLISAVLVFALLGNLTYLDLARQTSLEANPYNVRARQAEADVHRGQILAGSTVIADSVPSTDGNPTFAYQRVYSDGPLYAPVTGFFSYNYSTWAIENSYNSYLVGTDSSQWVQRLIDMASGRNPQGASVVTTIDPKLQQAAAAALSGYTGGIVVSDPHTGAVKALVTSPSYDPNQMATHDATAEEDFWASLKADDPEASPLTDRASRDPKAPGSTFKMIVAAAALEAGDTADTMIDTPAELTYPGSSVTLPNSANCGNTQVTLARALQLSCNTAFANLGRSLGAQAITEQAEKFGFNSEHLPELGGLASEYPKPRDTADLMRSAIGQGSVTATPLQMAMVAGAFLNGGLLAEPYLVQEVRGPDLKVLYQHETKQSQAVSPTTAQTMKDMMVSVVEKGLGSPAAIPGVTVGGKSGTAENDESSYGWFVSFSLDPDIVVSVFLEKSDSTDEGLWGSGDAAPLAKKVMEASR